jgi:ribosomal protein S18 acetylase RimI-like enzyme
VSTRAFRPGDAERVDRVAVAAFSQFENSYDDWPRFIDGIGRMSRLAETAELIVVETDGVVAGAVAYVPPGAPKADWFEPGWPVIRMLVVDPAFRGRGIGRELTEACIAHAVRDGAREIALHTSEIMTTARAMYLRMGFLYRGATPPISGVAYGLYVKSLATD